MPRTDCPDHGVKRIRAPWACAGCRFTLLFEQAAMMLAREMPVLAAARLDLSRLKALGLDETASKRGQSARNPLVSAQPLLQNAIGLSPERFRVTLNRVGGIHMGNPGQ